MKLAEKIFKRKDFYVTSAFGYRKDPINGATKFHSGCDYGTNVEKWKQYAIENGSVISCGIASDGAKYVWVKYPRLNIKLLHYHLDSISVKAGQAVNENTILGYTGKTGRATGIHLHLGMKYLNKDSYVDPHAYNYEEAKSVDGDIDDLANRVIKGEFGNGQDRKNALGDKYNEVQARVNEILYGKKPSKSVDELAREVIAGKWGNGQERKDRLTKAGYNYNEVQARVNQIIYG